VQQQLVAFAIVAGLLTITPGLDTALVLRYSLTQSKAVAFATSIGITAGLLVWGIAASVGVSALLTASQVAYDVLRVVGALYMAWLGFRLIRAALRRDGGHEDADVPPAPETLWSGFRSGFLTNLLNPKIGAFYVAVLPQFIPAGTPSLGGGVALTMVHVVESLVWFALLIVTAAAMRQWLERRRRAIDAVTGAVLLLFAARLALVR